MTSYLGRPLLTPYHATRASGTRLVTWARELPRYQWLLAILAFQSGFSLLALRNSVSQDEALYLTAGRQIVNQLLGGRAAGSYLYRFSGLPYLYPPIAGVLDAFGGLELARLLSLVCMLGTTIVVYLVGRHLYDERSGVAGAALFSIQAPILLIGRLATYDAACLLMLALTTLLALRAGSARSSYLAALVPAPLLLAVATKYVGELFVPTVVAILAIETWHAQGWRPAIRRTALALGVISAALLIGWLFLSRSDITAIRLAATTRAVESPLPRLELLRRSLLLGIGLSCLAAIGCYFGHRRRLSGVLLATVALAPAFHLWRAEPVSLEKHVGYGLFFAAPLAGYGLVCLLQGTRRRQYVGIALVLLTVSLGLEQAPRYYHDWPGDSAMIEILRQQLPASGEMLVEDPEIVRYELGDWQVDAPRHYVGLYSFAYVDRAGQHLSGIAAYKAAISERYFDFVILRYGPNRLVDDAIDGDLRAGKLYDLVAAIPYTTRGGSGTYWIWRKKSAIGMSPGPVHY